MRRLLVVALLLVAVKARGQGIVTNIQTIPSNLTITNSPTVPVAFQLQGWTTFPVTVTFIRNLPGSFSQKTSTENTNITDTENLPLSDLGMTAVGVSYS